MRHLAVLVACGSLLGYSAAAVPLDGARGGPLDVRIGVFGLFHSRELVVSPAGGVISVRGDRERCVLRGSEEARIHLDGTSIRVACPGSVFTTRAVHGDGAMRQSEGFALTVPGRISRRFQGRLHVIAAAAELIPVVSMDLETAVASIVAAEQIATTAPEALKAQAVAARSFLVAAGPRHREFDFCDTTHCQFLREPPPADHPGGRAARDTAGIVLAYRGEPLAAFYSARCGGRTRTLAEAGLQPSDGYPYFSVECAYCMRQRDGGDAGGHGVGLCQQGAAAMAARRGTSFADILRHYYPGTTLEVRAR